LNSNIKRFNVRNIITLVRYLLKKLQEVSLNLKRKFNVFNK